MKTCLLFLIACTVTCALKTLGDDYLAKKPRPPVFALFASDDCARCPKFEGELDDIGKTLQAELKKLGVRDEHRNVEVVKFDVRKSPAVIAEFEIEGVPTLALVRGNYVHEYGGRMDAPSVAAWMARRLGPCMTALKSQAAAATFIADHDVTIIANVNESYVGKLEPLLEPLRDIPMYGWQAKTKPDDIDELVLHKWGLDKPIRHRIDWTNADEVQGFIVANQIPLFGEINLSNLNAYLIETRPFVWLVGSEADHLAVKNEFRPLVSEGAFSRPLYWVWLNPRTSRQAAAFVRETLKVPTDCSLMLTDLDGAGRFYFNGDVRKAGAAKIRQWVKDVLEGKVERHLSSMPKPARAKDSMGLEKLVQVTLEDRLQRQGKYEGSALTLIVDSPWCTQCQELARQLAKIRKWLEDANAADCLHMARIDGMKNELDPQWDLTLNFFPTAWVFPVDKNLKPDTEVRSMKKVAFSGPLHEADVWQWLRRNSGCELGKVGPVKDAVETLETKKRDEL